MSVSRSSMTIFLIQQRVTVPVRKSLTPVDLDQFECDQAFADSCRHLRSHFVAATADEGLDFLIMPLSGADGFWLVFRQIASSSSCVAVCENREEALENAVRMAQYQVSSNRQSQVHCRDSERPGWYTVWCPPGCAPKFPSSIA